MRMMQALVIADDLSPLGEIERVLAGRGWEVARVKSAGAAVEWLRSGDPRLVIVQEDAAGTGSSACSILRRSGLQRMPYLVGFAWKHDQAAIRRLVAAGADDVIGAPCDAVEAETRLRVAEARIGTPEGAGSISEADHAHALDEIQRRLHVQQAFLEGLFESAPEGIVILDREDRIVRINGEFTRVFGYTPAEAIGQALNDLIVPEELRREGTELDGGVRRGERVMVETVRRHRDGRLIEVSVLAKHIEVNGRPVGMIGIYRDITEKKQREAALRESEGRYRALFDQSPVGVFLCDRELRITHCNEYLTTLVGAAYEDIVGADLLQLRNSRLLPGLRAALEGDPAFYEGPYLAPTGKYLHVSVQYAPLRNELGQVIGGIGVLEDISQRVSSERQLRSQAAEMERVNRALRERTLELEAAMKARSRLYSAMNHELRTPISAIMLYQELLLAGTLGPLEEEQRRALDHSHAAALHLLDLVRDILDLGKIEAGKVGIQLTEVDIGALLGELRGAVGPLAERHGCSLTIDCPPGLGRTVTDPQRLRQILMNFVSNAAKYGRTNPIIVRCRLAAAGLAFEVIDQGIGIAKEDLENIFDDFVQLGSGKFEGTGLGLAICRRLAELLGARLEVESEIDVGSTFRVILPQSDRPRTEPE